MKYVIHQILGLHYTREMHLYNEKWSIGCLLKLKKENPKNSSYAKSPNPRIKCTAKNLNMMKRTIERSYISN